MSDAIKGTKSIDYDRSEVSGLQNTGDNYQHLTIQEAPGKRGAADTVIHGMTVVSTGHIVEVGSARKLIKSTAHGAQQGWIMRMTSGNSQFQEISIIKIIDADNFVISSQFDIALADTFDVARLITANYDADGNVVVAPPVGGATAANQVLEIAQLTAINANTDGLETLVTAGNASLTSIDGKTPALGQALMAASTPVVIASNQPAFPVTGPLTDTELRATPVPVSGPLTDAQLRATPVPVSGTVTANAGTNLNTSLLALETTQVANGVLLGSVTETAPGTDTASSGLNGRLQRIAQRITSLIALFPTSLGQNTMANSFAVTLASDQSALSTSQAALAATYQEITNLTTAAQTFTAPAGAKWAKVYADGNNAENIRVKIGGVASATSGIRFEPSRSEDFMAVGNISVFAEAGSNQIVNVTFGA